MSFILFFGTDYYPEGGALDFLSFHDSLDEARRRIQELPGSAHEGYWANILDTDTKNIERWNKPLPKNAHSKKWHKTS